jgi:hypothetical protein
VENRCRNPIISALSAGSRWHHEYGRPNTDFFSPAAGGFAGGLFFFSG